MAENTPLNLRNAVFYMVFVRNHSEEGSLKALERDLDRICSLGVDYVWLLPCQPIGKLRRKGSLGSPYAISDYRAINPELGTMEDFVSLSDAIHARGLKLILDIVYNHTSPDSLLVREHTDWFYRKADGSPGNRIGEWWDVVDLDYRHRELWDYQIETLCFWANYVDGFRCDVAPMLPLDFWWAAREAVEAVRPGCVWIAESVEPEFIRINRQNGIPTSSDGELFRVFDLCYDYDIYGDWKRAMLGTATIERYVEDLNRQEGLFPENYVKLRNLENHDRPRAAALIPDRRVRENWTAFLYFAKGATLLYAGQERSAVHRPTLFDRDTVDWRGEDLSPLMRKLYELKKQSLFTDSGFCAELLCGDVLFARHESKHGTGKAYGFFSLSGKTEALPSPLPDGRYRNAIDGELVDVYEGVLPFPGRPLVIITE